MKLLNLPLSSVRAVRTQFATKECLEIWNKKIPVASKFFKELEIETVAHGLRECAIASVAVADVDTFCRNLSKKGLIFVPIMKLQNSSSFYHVNERVDNDNLPLNYLMNGVVTTSTTLAEHFIKAYESRDDIEVGRLLGFPVCCRNFFDEIWQNGYVDPIWQQADNTKNTKKFYFPDEVYNIDKHIVKIKSGNHEIVSALRYIGVRIVSHIPCSCDCEESMKIAKERIELARKLEMEGLSETLEILQLPYEWDCLKGIAIINTPVFKIVVDSVPCFPRYIVRKESDFYPDEAPSGLVFPWKNPLFR